ncbi:glycosyl hydrolases family 31 domain-containing protein [Phthorimaea operculella]|nr:glycosyl hydrolases family 31 domain-containing protein [Phthorimaea operculella]
MPYDSHCGVAPVVFHDDCQVIEHRDSVVKGLQEIRNRKKRFVPHISPHRQRRASLSLSNDWFVWGTRKTERRRLCGAPRRRHVDSALRSSGIYYEDFVAFTTTAASEKLPYDSHCGVAPVVFHDDCQVIEHRDSVVKGLQEIRNRKKRFVPHISPHILYKEAEDDSNNSTETVQPRGQHYLNCSNLVTQFENHFLKTDSGVYQGLVNNEPVVYPDYEMASEEFMQQLWSGPEVDAVVLENTSPADQSVKLHNETRLLLPYFNEHFEAAFDSTPQWNVRRPNDTIYMYTHNQYGNHFREAFRSTLQKRIPVYTSTLRMTGEIANRQNVHASWANLQKELIEVALAGISGNWFTSSPICGDSSYNDTTQTQLCVKWYMAATYLPLIKTHSKETARHPLAFTGTNKANILKAINQRYSLLPYFYTTLQKGPLLRPMFYQFPFSNVTNSKTQFSVGDDLLIAPNLQPSQSHVHIQMPPGRWFEFLGGQALLAEEGETVTMATTAADFLTFIRGGSIVVMQKDTKETAEETRKTSSFYLTVALDCEVSNTTETSRAENVTVCKAKGELYMNENMTIIMEANSEEMKIHALGDDFTTFCDSQNGAWFNMIREINVYGLDEKYNNFDNYRNVVAWANLCQLQSQEEIVVKLI